MSVKYWGDPVSQPCRTIEFILRKLNIEHENNHTVLFKDTRSEEFKKVNPRGKVPVIEHDGTKFFESASMARYLLDVFEGPETLLPRADLKARAEVDALLDWNATTARPGITNGALAKIVLGPTFFGAPKPTEEETKTVMDGLYAVLDEIEERTGKHQYLASDDLSIADVQVYNEYVLAHTMLKFDTEKYPNTVAWASRLAEDPIVKELDEAMNKRLAEMSSS